MKKLILFGLFALALAGFSSCKLTKCDCPSSMSYRVNGNDEATIRANCEAQSNGYCTYYEK